MTPEQAKRILDEHKETGCHSILTVTRALWTSGDLCGVDGHLLEAGEEPILEGMGVGSSERVGC
jgi:hypothetical protein